MSPELIHTNTNQTETPRGEDITGSTSPIETEDQEVQVVPSVADDRSRRSAAASIVSAVADILAKPEWYPSKSTLDFECEDETTASEPSKIPSE